MYSIDMRSPIIDAGIEVQAGNLQIDTILAKWMTGILFTVQNLATDKHVRQLPDGSKVHRATDIGEMRKVLYAEGTERVQNRILRTPNQMKPIVAYILSLSSVDNIPVLLKEVQASYRHIHDDSEREEWINKAIAQAYLGIETAERCDNVLTGLQA